MFSPANVMGPSGLTGGVEAACVDGKAVNLLEPEVKGAVACIIVEVLDLGKQVD